MILLDPPAEDALGFWLVFYEIKEWGDERENLKLSMLKWCLDNVPGTFPAHNSNCVSFRTQTDALLFYMAFS